MTEYSRKVEDIPADELQNWPKGCSESTHTFMDLEVSPIVKRPYFHNEEVFYLYKLRWNDLVFNYGMKSEEAQIQAKIELLDIIYPHVDLINFRENNPAISDQCCRLIFQMTLEGIGSIHIVHGEGIKFYGCGMGADIDLGSPADPIWGFDLTKPEEGFPCINLHEEDGGCHYHESGDKPDKCKRHPVKESDVQFINTCSYSFDENGVRTSTCNKCMG
jgi:hypothetical protein